MPDKYKCTICQETFTSPLDLNEHHYDKHLMEEENIDSNTPQRNEPQAGALEEPINENDTNFPSHDMIPVLNDPNPVFSGKKLENGNAYICYLNSIVNGLLSLKTFRQLIQFMEPSMKVMLTSVLEDDLNSLEQLRHKLYQRNSDFDFGTHCDPSEALTSIMELIDLNVLYQKSLAKIKRHQTCSACGDESTFDVDDPYGNPNVLKLKLSNENSVQDEVNAYIQNFGSNEPKTSFCPKCQEPQLMRLKDSLETSEIVIITIYRFQENGVKNYKNVVPNDTINIGTLNYKLKCFLSHHGTSVKRGHYTSTIPLGNEYYYLYDDSIRTVQRKVSEDPYMLFYEKMDPNTSSSSEIPEDVPMFFQEQAEYSEQLEKEFIYPICLHSEFTRRAIMNKDNDGKQIPLLGYVVGYRDDNRIIGTELVYPEQFIDGPNLNDLGKLY